MKKTTHEKILKDVCDYLGQDINSEQCAALKKHLKECPDCDIYFDTIKKTVMMYRKSEKPCVMPLTVKSSLFKILELKSATK